jgi:cyclophilin family peptidyl-prolyl cis-trans isomerase
MQQRKAAIIITRPSSQDDDARTNKRIVRRLQQPRRNNNGSKKTIKSMLRYGMIISLSLSIIIISIIGIFNPPTITGAIRFVLEYGVLPVVLSTAPVAEAAETSRASGALKSTTTTIVDCFVSTPHIKNTTDGGTDGREVAEGTIRITIQTYNNIQSRTTGSSAEAFMNLIDEYQFYDGSYTFRVIKDFVVQFGHHNANNNANKKNNVASNRILQSDITGDEILSNIRGTITMIPGRTGQVFINLGKYRKKKFTTVCLLLLLLLLLLQLLHQKFVCVL